MRIKSRIWFAGLFLASAVNTFGTVRHVDVNSTNSTPPYADWATAATNIQDAVDASIAGDEIVVTNGTYAPVLVDKSLMLRSINGPQFTTIDGAGSSRCAYLTNGASLSGFTLTRGSVPQSAHAESGAGAYGGTLNNCTLTNNYIFSEVGASGVGAYGCVLNNCTISGNSGLCPPSGCFGGGAAGCTLNNCTLSGNSAGGGGATGGGAFRCTLYNCILSGNSANYYGGAAGCVLNNCTLTGNDGGAFGSTLNNCIVYFNTMQGKANYDSSSTLNYSCTTPQPVKGLGNITNAPLFANQAFGDLHLRPDSPCIDAGANLSVIITSDLDGRSRPLDGNGDGLAAFDMGAYEYRTPLLVSQDSPNPTSPYTTWAMAATNIQDAVDVALPGDEIVVTNGIYATGGATNGFGINRVAVDKPLALRSINGPRFTVIDGVGSARCLFLVTNASVTGFTLTNGVGPTDEGDGGGGVLGGGTLNECILSGNVAVGSCRGTSCSGAGGGASGCVLNNCILSGNSAAWGGGVSGGVGGGAFECTLNNCTVVGNSAPGGVNGSAKGGGAFHCTLSNCIVYFNTAFSSSSNCDSSCTLNYSCTTLQPATGFGNITNDPAFVNLIAGNLHLCPDSPCINAGLNSFAPGNFDLGGSPRIVGGTVDIGAYEFQSPTSIISYAWLQQYGLPTDGSADASDPDGDGLNNWQEWRCGTDPTNAASALRLLAPVTDGNNLTVSWQSVAGVGYFLERSPAASSAFTPLAVAIAGQAGTTTFTDTNAFATGPWFYRVGVAAP